MVRCSAVLLYALERGLKMKWMAVLFCIFTAIAAFGIGNSVQANSSQCYWKKTMQIPTQWSGIICCIGFSSHFLWGAYRKGHLCFGAIYGYFLYRRVHYHPCINAPYLLDALSLIIDSAFSPKAAGGGFVGSTIMVAARFGIARGLFPTNLTRLSAHYRGSSKNTQSGTSGIGILIVTSLGQWWSYALWRD